MPIDLVFHKGHALSLHRIHYDSKGLAEELGDLLFATVSLARLSGFDCEEILNLSTDKFLTRFKKTEELILKDGKDMKSLTADEIDYYYNVSKKN